RSMMEVRPDWCISRQRDWGVPIVAFFCAGCGETLATRRIADHVADLFEREGADAWFERSPKELLPTETRCGSCGNREFRKEQDILDVWFDSGMSHAAVLEQRAELRSPADLYLAGDRRPANRVVSPDPQYGAVLDRQSLRLRFTARRGCLGCAARARPVDPGAKPSAR